MHLFRNILFLFPLMFMGGAAHAASMQDSLYSRAEEHFRKGSYAEALKMHMNLLRLCEKTGDCNLEGNALLSVGKIHYYLQQRAEARSWFSKSLAMAERCGNDSIRIRSLMNLGAIAFETRKTDSGLAFFYISEQLLTNKDVVFEDSRKYTLLTTLYCMMAEALYRGKNEKAKGYRYVDLAEQAAARSGQDERMGFVLAKRGILNLEDGNCTEAERSFKKALAIYQKTRSMDGMFYAMGLTAKAMGYCGKGKETYLMMHAMQQMRDSVFKTETAEKTGQYQALYETEKKEQANILLQKENQLGQLRLQNAVNSRNIILVVSVAGISLALLGFLFAYNRYRLKKEAEMSREVAAQQLMRFRSIIETEEKERVRIAREMHDGIGHLLSAARLNISALTPAGFDDETVLNNSMTLIDDAVKEVRTISHNLMPASLTELGMVPALRELAKKISDSGKVKLSLEIRGAAMPLEPAVEIAVYRIVQEIVSNMLKHAKANLILMTLEYSETGLYLSLKDNGVGFDTGIIEQSNGIGWKNIFSRVDMLHGKAEVQSIPGAGTTVNLFIPI